METFSALLAICEGNSPVPGDLRRHRAHYDVTVMIKTKQKHPKQGSTLLAFVKGIHRSPADSPHKDPVTQKTFPYGVVIMMIFLLDSCVYLPISLGQYQTMTTHNRI